MRRRLTSEFEIRRHLVTMLAGDSSLREFDAWFTKATWERASVAPDARDLAGNVGLLLDEFTSGVWTWPELEVQLKMVAGSAVASWGEAALPRTVTGATEPVTLELALAL